MLPKGKVKKMLINELQNKNIMIWGMGAEGRSAKEYLETHKITDNIITYNDETDSHKLADILAQTDVIIRSPGVSIYKPEIKQARSAGIKITSCSDIFLSEIRNNHPQTKVIGISGSKGKSTSVSMLYHMLHKLGYNVALGGNIGKPLIELIDGSYDYIICEFSSYQASDLTNSPHIVMFTNLFSVHTDWHGGHNNYCMDKIHLSANQHGDDICIVNANNAQLRDYCKSCHNIIYYGDANGFYAEGKELFWKEEKLLSIDELKISGNHNMDNLAGVACIIKSLDIDFRAALKTLADFEPLPHRLQKVGTVNGILFVNDSISTAPEAAIGGMQSFDDDMAIISGGIENHQDYQQYAEFINHNPKVKVVVTLFQCGPQIADTIRRFVKRPDFKLIEASSLEEGVKLAYEELGKINGKLVLFSPTAPSFGYYKNFMERGEHFIKIVKSLEK